MELRELGRTGLKVSALCLGTMTWGEQNSEAEGHAQMDYAFGEGINFFDTAELYPIAPRAATYGRTEEIIGTWLAARKCRDKIILATKVTGRSVMDWQRKDGSKCRLSRDQIFEAIEGSLRRLRTDYVDLYQLHWPDRPMRLFGGLEYEPHEGDAISFEETLGALGDLVKQGKVRHIGLSNETPWGVMTCLHLARTGGLPRVHSIQNAYNLLNRSYEIGLSEITAREQVSLLAYSPLGQGFLTGKYMHGALPAGSRKAVFEGRLRRYETPGAAAAIEKYVALARERGLDPGQMAIQFVTTRPFVTSNIFGATTMDQLKNVMASTKLDMSDDLLEQINAIHLVHSNPCP